MPFCLSTGTEDRCYSTVSSLSPGNCCCMHTIRDVSILGKRPFEDRDFSKPLLVLHKLKCICWDGASGTVWERSVQAQKAMWENVLASNTAVQILTEREKKKQYKSMLEQTTSMFFNVKELTKDRVNLVDKITKADHFYAKFKCIFFENTKSNPWKSEYITEKSTIT